MDINSNNTTIKTIYTQLGMAKILLETLIKQKTITYQALYEKLSSIQTVLKRVSENAKQMDTDYEYEIPDRLNYPLDVFACPDKYDLYFCSDLSTIKERGCIGFLRGDFGKNGNEFYTTWTNHQSHLNTEAFKQEFDNIINTLRENLFMSRDIMRMICSENPESKSGDWYYFMCITQGYEYYIRCFPEHGDYNFYIYCYDRKEGCR